MSLRVKRHYKLVVLLALVAVVLILGLGDQRIVPYTVQGSAPVVELDANDNNAVVWYDDPVAQSSPILTSGAGFE